MEGRIKVWDDIGVINMLHLKTPGLRGPKPMGREEALKRIGFKKSARKATPRGRHRAKVLNTGKNILGPEKGKDRSKGRRGKRVYKVLLQRSCD